MVGPTLASPGSFTLVLNLVPSGKPGPPMMTGTCSGKRLLLSKSLVCLMSKDAQRPRKAVNEAFKNHGQKSCSPLRKPSSLLLHR